MITATHTMKNLLIFMVALLLFFFGSACTNPTPAIQTIQVTQLATILVTRKVTQEVTRVIEVRVTVTPEDTPVPTFATASDSTGAGPTASITKLPMVIILKNSDCMYGPASGYLYKYSVTTANPMETIGRNLDGTWLYIQALGGWNPCWIQSSLIKLVSGDINALPIVYSSLPYSNQYNPPNATAHRDDTDVTVSWKAVWMSLDDYRGYLIEAWTCKGGEQVFSPIFYVPPLANNTGTLSVRLTDDPGCTLPSRARIYSAQKQGYSFSNDISWPP
jgi:hypothetical protein